MEPDDRVALNLFAGAHPPEEVLLVGTTVKHSGRKKVLAQRLLEQVGYKGVPVIQGQGGHPEVYLEIASSKAARTYAQEGENILSPRELQEIEKRPYSSGDLESAVIRALEKNQDVEIVMLAPPTDLVAVIEKRPDLIRKIKHIHIMGGWIEVPGATALPVRRTTYNWNMDPGAAAKLLQHEEIPMTLYSSHVFKTSFSGGSINDKNYPKIIDGFRELQTELPSIGELKTATLSWDRHIMENIPVLKPVIEPFAGSQFTPTDPSVVLGIENPKIIEKSSRVSIRMDLGDLDPARGYSVNVVASETSNIHLVDKVDTVEFESTFLKLLKRLPEQVRMNQVNQHGCQRLMNEIF